MAEERTIITDMEHSRDLMVEHRPTAERTLTGHPHADDISRALDGWLAASALLESAGVPGDKMNALHCLTTSIYAMGYERGKRETNLPVFVVRDPEEQPLSANPKGIE